MESGWVVLRTFRFRADVILEVNLNTQRKKSGCPQNHKLSASDFPEKIWVHWVLCCVYVYIYVGICKVFFKKLPPASPNFPQIHRLSASPVELRFGGVVLVDVETVVGISVSVACLLGTSLALATLKWQAMGQRVCRRRGLERCTFEEMTGWTHPNAGVEIVLWQGFAKTLRATIDNTVEGSWITSIILIPI